MAALVGMLFVAAALLPAGAAPPARGGKAVLKPLPRGTATWVYRYTE